MTTTGRVRGGFNQYGFTVGILMLDTRFPRIPGDMPPIAQRAYRARVIARHVALIKEHFAERFALIQLKKHLSWYTEGLGHARECRAAIFQTKTADEVWETFQRYWERSAHTEASLLEIATA